MNLTTFIWNYVKLQRWKFLFIFLLCLVWPLDVTMMPYILRQAVDTFTRFDLNRAEALPHLTWILISGAAVWCVVESGFRIRGFVEAKALPQLQADIRMAMFDHIQHHSPKYFNEHFAGGLSNKISDMVTQASSIMETLTLFFPVLVSCIVSLVLFFQVNAFFALILASWILIHFLICFTFAFKCVNYSHVHGEARTNLTGKIVDSLTNNFAVNLFCRFQYERARLSPWQNDELKKNIGSKKYIAKMFVLLSLVFFLAAVSLNGLAVHYWLQGKVTTGEIVQIFNTFMNVTFLIWFAAFEIPRFLESLGIANQALTVMQDPKDVLDPPHASPLSVKRGEIIFENVSFYYGKKRLFENKDVHIKAGEKVGLVGYSGAGKSTFVSLILRFYPVQKGRILIDGQDIANVTLESLRSQVALIPQDPQLFHRTLEENVRYGRVEATSSEVRAAAALAHCEEFVSRCQDGYATLVGERGTKLSGGERQRIAIARAILAAPPILLLDEATSALDSVTEKYIQESLEKLMEGRTTLVIAHRLSTLSKMDRILVFDQGRVVEEGTHLELLAKNSHYAYMWQLQSGGFLPNKP